MTTATGWNDWARMDLWIEPEFVRICCGIDPGDRYLSNDQRDAVDRATIKIQRAVDAGALRCRQAIGEHRQFAPASAIDWARTRFKTLPQELVDAVEAMRQPPKVSRWPWGEYETAHLRVLAAAVNEWVRFKAGKRHMPKRMEIIGLVRAQRDANGTPISETVAKAIATMVRADDASDKPEATK